MNKLSVLKYSFFNTTQTHPCFTTQTQQTPFYSLTDKMSYQQDLTRVLAVKYGSVYQLSTTDKKRIFEDTMNADSQQAIPLRQHVQNTISRYLKDMGKTAPENLYQMLMAEIEPPLIEEVLKCTGGNQSRASNILGITRNTLRTKMQRYSIKAQSGKLTRLKR